MDDRDKNCRYCLDRLLMPSIPQIVAATFVKQVEFHAEIGSTNDRALDLAAAEVSPETPLLIWALQQTAGRGRGANRWWASEGSLTFSLMLDTSALHLPQERWPQVSLTTGLAVCAALQELLPQAEIGLKWPNDVFLHGRKICGILVEIPPRQSGKLIVGIGINVNNSLNAAPAELWPTATALCDASNRPWDLADVLIQVLQQLERHLCQLSANDPELPQRWHELCFLRGRLIHHTVGDRVTIGRCQGVDQQGALLLQTETGLSRVLGGVITKWE